MAELRIQLRLPAFFPDRTTPSATSSRTLVIARTHHRQNTDNSVVLKKSGSTEHHFWKKREAAHSGQKALNLVRLVSNLSNEKEVVYGALDKWAAFDAKFPVIAVAKSLVILRRKKQWLRIIQVCKWLFSKGQVLTWSTYDTLIVAFNMEGRIDEAESFYNSIIKTHDRSAPKRIFSRIIAMYDHHNLPHKVLEVFADMEELGIHPDGDTTWRIGRAFVGLEQPEKGKMVLEKYLKKWKYLYFEGERIRVKRGGVSDPFAKQLKIQ